MKKQMRSVGGVVSKKGRTSFIALIVTRASKDMTIIAESLGRASEIPILSILFSFKFTEDWYVHSWD